ncbi:hypothetical protein [Halobacillus ihumii]|uniref:hypothetical protein n=1 Tax=Halobacillus ihumii TaxID=2686092 RepID=UPI0013CF812B|nr:hypothetical protein [Halobacillus ihumii]
MLLLQVLFLIALTISLYVFIRRAKHFKRRNGTYGSFKMYMTSLCFFTIGIFNFIILSLDLLGAVSWFITIALLMLGAYFTKFLNDEDRKRYAP